MISKNMLDKTPRGSSAKSRKGLIWTLIDQDETRIESRHEFSGYDLVWLSRFRQYNQDTPIAQTPSFQNIPGE